MLDIFTPVVGPEELHHNFKTLLASSHEATRAEISSWTKNFVDRDGKIIKEFQTTFNSSFWEFYLNAVFRELGFEMDFSHSRPDFLIKKSGMTLAAEAVIANHACGARPEWLRNPLQKITSRLSQEIVQMATIRLANAIASKYKKFRTEYALLGHLKDTPFLLCIAPFEQPLFFAQSDNAIRRVLYKFSAPLYIKDEKTGNVTIVGEEYVDVAAKDNNTEIDLGFFTDDRMSEISAVVFSSTATITKAQALRSEKFVDTLFSATRYRKDSWDIPYYELKRGGAYKETILDGLHIFLNPYARVKFNPSLIYNADISYHYFDVDSKQPITISKDGALISHSCMTFNVRKEDTTKIPREAFEGVFEAKIPEWQDDRLYELSAVVGLGVNNHIAHFSGWTVVVFQDAIDGDWGAIARRVAVYSLQEFLLSRAPELMAQDFYPSKELAFLGIKREIAATANV